MTCIIALEHEDGVVLGSDSYLGTDVSKDTMDRPKFCKKGPKFYIASAGDIRPAQIIEYELKFRRKKKIETDEEYLVNYVFRAIREAFAREDNIKEPFEYTFIIVLSGKAYTVQNDLSVSRSRNGFCATGSAEDFALGALAALIKRNDLTPEQKVSQALAAAHAVSQNVSPPFHIISI